MDYLNAAKRNNQCNFKIHKIHKCTVISKKKKKKNIQKWKGNGSPLVCKRSKITAS